jgi:hypothetical protein
MTVIKYDKGGFKNAMAWFTASLSYLLVGYSRFH